MPAAFPNARSGLVALLVIATCVNGVAVADREVTLVSQGEEFVLHEGLYEVDVVRGTNASGEADEAGTIALEPFPADGPDTTGSDGGNESGADDEGEDDGDGAGSRDDASTPLPGQDAAVVGGGIVGLLAALGVATRFLP
jgi:hypothetical protein